MDSQPHPTVARNAGAPFELDRAVVKAFPVKGTRLIQAVRFGGSLLTQPARIFVELPGGKTESYFLKVFCHEEARRLMCEGEFESMKAIHAVSPRFAPQPFGWGRYENEDSETYFLLQEFRHFGRQPAEPLKLAEGIANLHRRSESPTGKFGFQVKTCHGKIVQHVDQWDDSWAALFGRHLGHFMELAKPVLKWPEFDAVCQLTLQKVVPRLLLPLQANGRVLKPSLIHGDCHDYNTALDAETQDAFVFDACSFYGHNEYDTGNWRAPRHLLSDRAYIDAYQKLISPSEPVEDWDSRNILYSLTYNIGNTLYIPGSTQRQVIFDDMVTLCERHCKDDLKAAMVKLTETPRQEE